MTTPEQIAGPTEADLAKTLEELSAAATQGVWEVEVDTRTQVCRVTNDELYYTAGYNISGQSEVIGCEGIIPGPNSEHDASLITALVNAYRTGQLIVVDHPQATSPVDEPINATDAAFMAGEAIYQRDGVSPFLREVMQLKRDNNAKPVDDRGGAVCEQQMVEGEFAHKVFWDAITTAGHGDYEAGIAVVQAALIAARAQVDGEIARLRSAIRRYMNVYGVLVDRDREELRQALGDEA